MSAAWYWAQATSRRRLGGVVLLVLVLAVGAGGAMGAAAGARRGATAGERLAAGSAVPEAFVVAADPATFDAMVAVPEVAAASGFTLLGLQPETVPCSDDPGSYFQVAGAAAGRPFAVPRPRLVDGRFSDQSNPGEAVVSEQHARRLGVGVGDRIRFLPYLLGEDGVTGCGEHVVAEVEVVGVIRELFEIGAGDEPTLASTHVTSAFIAAHPEVPVTGPGVTGFVDLAAGTDPQDFADDLAERAPKDGDGQPLAVALVGVAGAPAPLQPALDAGAVGLWALAGVVALVAATVLALGLARQVAATATELRLLAVLGVRRRHRAAAAAAPGIVVVGLGITLAVVLATALSTVHLVGLADVVEPEPGFDLDLGVLLVGVLAVIVVVGALLAAIAWRASTAAGRPASFEGRSLRPGLAERLAAAGAPPWAALGAGYALVPGRRPALPARSALAGVVVGTAGVLAVLLFGLGVGRAGSDPAVYGWGTWDGLVRSDDDGDTSAVMAADPDVDGVAALQIRFKLRLDGEETNGLPVENIEGRSGPTVVKGRLPVGPSEIALGSATAGALGTGIGSTVDAEGPAGTATLAVVGITAFPAFDADPLATGWTADRQVVDDLGWPAGCNDETECFQTTAVVWRDGADVDTVVDRLRGSGFEVQEPEPGAEVLLIAEADGLPSVAAGVVALVAAAGLAHALTVTVARRRRELAVVRALGFDRAQVRRVLHVEGFVLGVTGGVLGAVAGLVIGGISWRAAARSIGIGPVLPSPTGLVTAVLVCVVALGVLSSLLPARFAVRATPAEALREED